MADARTRRLVNDEARLRDVNDELRSDVDGLHSAPAAVGFVCECSRPSCDASIELSLGAYDAIRAHDRRFAVRAGHETPAIETVVEEHPDYLVVEKHMDPADAGR